MPDPKTGEEDTFGCWCFMPIKVRFLDVNCWVWEKSGNRHIGYGWDDQLNGDYINEQRSKRVQKQVGHKEGG